MKTIVFSALFFFLFSSISQAQQDKTDISIHKAHQFVGQTATICSQVVDIFKPNGDNKNIYINFGGKFPDNIFTAVIFSKDLPKFVYNPLETFNNKNICITGKITEYKGKAQMVLNTPSQVSITE